MNDKEWKKMCEKEGLYANEEELMDGLSEDFDIKITEYRAIVEEKDWKKFKTRLLKQLKDFNHLRKECHDMYFNPMNKVCEKCGKQISDKMEFIVKHTNRSHCKSPERCIVCSTTRELTQHHLFPEAEGAKRKDKYVWMCEKHHKKLHSLYTNEELHYKIFTVDKIQCIMKEACEI